MTLDPRIFGFDFSKWQGNIDFSKVKAYGASFVTLRCSYGMTMDEKFREYIEECLKYFPSSTSVYHYYDPRFHPIAQADEVGEFLNQYKPNIRRVYMDLEFTWGGSYTASSYWKTGCERILSYGHKLGIYTRKTWWDDKVGSLASWFGQFPLWVAQYSSSLTLIPVGWTSAVKWQTGTPSIGTQVGTESLEVDYNIMDDQFYVSEFGGTLPPPPGGTMETHEGTVKQTLNVRSGPGTSYPQKLPPLGYLKAGDKLYGWWDKAGTQWFHMFRIVRTTGQTETWDAWASAINGDTTAPYISVKEISTPPPPTTTLPELPWKFEIGDDVKYVKQVVEGILKPK